MNNKINEFIHYEKIEVPGKKTAVYKIINTATNTQIAEIMWSPTFRKYGFFPREDTVFEQKCLRDIITTMDNIQKEYNEVRWNNLPNKN